MVASSVAFWSIHTLLPPFGFATAIPIITGDIYMKSPPGHDVPIVLKPGISLIVSSRPAVLATTKSSRAMLDWLQNVRLSKTLPSLRSLTYSSVSAITIRLEISMY